MKTKFSAFFSAILIAAGLSSCATDVRSLAGGVFPRPGGGYGFDLRRDRFGDSRRGSSFADRVRGLDSSTLLSPDVRLAGTPGPSPRGTPRLDRSTLLSPDVRLFGTPPPRRSTLSDRLLIDPGSVNPDALLGATPRRPTMADRMRIDTSRINPDVLLGAPVWRP